MTPFGLNNSPTGLLTAMISIFAGNAKYGIYFYLDDLLCATSSWHEHLKSLQVMFQTLPDNKLSCNPYKCEYGFTEVEYLGFRIGADGIKISDKKVKVIKAIAPPGNRKSLQRLLGLFDFWRRFVKDYTQKTFHMRHLLCNDTPFVWSEKCQKELDYLKQCLV